MYYHKRNLSLESSLILPKVLALKAPQHINLNRKIFRLYTFIRYFVRPCKFYAHPPLTFPVSDLVLRSLPHRSPDSCDPPVNAARSSPLGEIAPRSPPSDRPVALPLSFTDGDRSLFIAAIGAPRRPAPVFHPLAIAHFSSPPKSLAG
jgi:hypothetical protein